MSIDYMEFDDEDDEDVAEPESLDAALLMRLKLWILMLRSSRHVEYALRERFKTDFDVTLPRFDVMATLYRTPDGVTMSSLSRRLLVSNGNVTGIVDRLENEGFVDRFPDESDRRATLVALTEDGTHAFLEMAAAHRAWIGEMLGPLSNEDVRSMTEALMGLRDVQKKAEKAKRRARKEG